MNIDDLVFKIHSISAKANSLDQPLTPSGPPKIKDLVDSFKGPHERG